MIDVAGYEQRDNSGSIFVNNRKEQDNHPDRTGKAMIDGRMYWVSGWLKKKQDGEHWLSLAFKPMDEDQTSRHGGAASASSSPEPLAGDDVPF